MILDEILANKRREVEERRARKPLALGSLASLTEPGGARIDRGTAFTSALRQPGVAFIAEIKRKSPSGGDIRPDLSVQEIAHTYAAAGAAALSVLTDACYFGGSDTDLMTARRASGLPVLRKDFVVDPYQVLEARELGADAVLLIVRALGDTELRKLLELTQQCGLEALVEAHSAKEVERALDAGARVIGINNRDLDTLITDVSLALRLRPLVPAECTCVAESGISRPEDVAVLRQAGVDAVLVGESLLRATDPGARLRELVGAAMPARVGRGTR